MSNALPSGRYSGNSDCFSRRLLSYCARLVRPAYTYTYGLVHLHTAEARLLNGQPLAVSVLESPGYTWVYDSIATWRNGSKILETIEAPQQALEIGILQNRMLGVQKTMAPDSR